MSIKMIGRYQIKAEIGRGGMATVYHAFDPQFERDVAVKVLPREFLHDPEFRRRFQREARTIARLEHPAIVPVHDFGDVDGQLYLVMRLMTGGSLTAKMQKGPMPVKEIARIFNRLAQGLDSAHAQGIIHRDLKPDNILFDRWDEPYLADFGIVKLVQSSKTALTATGGIVGTPAYMSPEQVRANEALDGRSDLYALGVILFEMLTGQQPYRANTPIGQAIMHINEPVPRVLDSNPSLPPNSQQLIDRAMAKDKSARPDSAKILAQEIAALLVESPPTILEQSEPESRADSTSPDPGPSLQPLDEPKLDEKLAEVQPPAQDEPTAAVPDVEAWPETSVLVHPDLAPDEEPAPKPVDPAKSSSPSADFTGEEDSLKTIEGTLPVNLEISPKPLALDPEPIQPLLPKEEFGAEASAPPLKTPPPAGKAPPAPDSFPTPASLPAEPQRSSTRRPALWAAGIFVALAAVVVLIIQPWQRDTGTNPEEGSAPASGLAGFMATKWSEGFEATDLAYGKGSWAVVMTQGAAEAQQSWRLASDFPTNFIVQKWEEGFEVSSLAYGRGQWAIMLTKQEADRRQTFNLDSDFPGDYITQKWEDGFELTSVAYGGGQWALIMSQGREDRRQTWRLDDNFPEEYILQRWQAGFDVTSLAYGRGQWAVVLTERAADQRQSWRLASEFPQDYILEQWEKGFHINAMSYGSGQWAVILTQTEELRQTWRLSPDFN